MHFRSHKNLKMVFVDASLNLDGCPNGSLGWTTTQGPTSVTKPPFDKLLPALGVRRGLFERVQPFSRVVFPVSCYRTENPQ